MAINHDAKKSETERALDDLYEFSTKGFSYGKIATLLHLLESPSVTAAAKKKGNDPSRFTADITELDGFFGVKLRQNVGKTTTLSPEGRELALLLRRHLLEIRGWREKYTDLKFVSLAAGDSLLHVLVLPKLHEIQSSFKNTTVSVSAARTHEIIRGLQDFTLDVGMLRESSLPRKTGQQGGNPLDYEPIGDYRYAIFVPQTLSQKTGDETARIAGLPMAIIKYHWDTNFLQLAKENNIIFSDVRVLCENFIQVYHLVRTGQYAGILPIFCEPMLNRFGNEPRVECVTPSFLEKPTHKIVLAWNPSLGKIRPKLKQFVGFTADKLRTAFNPGD